MFVLGSEWAVFYGNSSLYQPIVFAELRNLSQGTSAHRQPQTVAAAVLDVGRVDGVRRVLFGNSLVFWLQHLLFVDAINFLTEGQMSLSLSRYVQIDIDDIFVGRTGIRMNEADVLVCEKHSTFRKIMHTYKYVDLCL